VLAGAEARLTPAADGLPISTEVGLTLTHGTLKSVTLADENGRTVSGVCAMMRARGLPDEPLAFHTRYTATVVATGETARKSPDDELQHHERSGAPHRHGPVHVRRHRIRRRHAVVVEFMTPWTTTFARRAAAALRDDRSAAKGRVGRG
jgi:hypothetical protein